MSPSPLPMRRNSHISLQIPEIDRPPPPLQRRRSSAGRLQGGLTSFSATTLGDEHNDGYPQCKPNESIPRSLTRQTPLPRKQMAVVFLVTFVEPLQFGVLFPFVLFMVQDYFPKMDRDRLGTLVGLLTSAYCLAQLVTSLPWGFFSDRIGRKPVLLFGLSGNAICMTFFGLAGQYWQALLFRAICGALNGNVGVAKSIIGEITDGTNRSLAFALWETAFGLGAIVGPVIGGLLSDPVNAIGGPFKNSTFFTEKPYFLPCAACALFSVTGILLVIFGYSETLPILCKETAGREQSTSTVDSNRVVSFDSIPAQASSRSLFTCKVLLPATAYGLWALVQVTFDETLSIYAVSSRDTSGLGLSSRVLGLVLAATGVLQVFYQAVCYPICEKRIGVFGCLKGACLAMVVFVVSVSFVGAVAEGEVGTAVALSGALAGRTASIVFGYISIMILINDSAPSKSMLGAVHGLGQMASSAARAIGPAMAGALWTQATSASRSFPFDSHLPFELIALIAVATGCIAVAMTRMRL